MVTIIVGVVMWVVSVAAALVYLQGAQYYKDRRNREKYAVYAATLEAGRRREMVRAKVAFTVAALAAMVVLGKALAMYLG